MEVVEGSSTERETEEDEVGGGEFTTVEEGEGVGSIGRKMMPVDFFCLGAAFGTSESSSSESDSEGFRTISVGGGGTSLSDRIQKDQKKV